MFQLFFCKMSSVINIIVFIVFGFFSLTGGDILGTYEDCLTPTGRQGICRSLKECSPLLGLLIRNKWKPNSRVINFLIRSHCGFDGKNPIVCCPTSAKLKDAYVESVKVTTEDPHTGNFLNMPCGRIQTEDKIFGGNFTELREFPWIALIGYKTKNGLQFRCGGSLISRRYVLTAAHCVTGLKNIYPISVRLGEYDVGSIIDCQKGKGCSLPVKDVDIEEIFLHPGFVKPDLRNDIALIRLAKTISIEDRISPICLPLSVAGRLGQDERAIVAGWGLTESGIRSHVLKKVSLPIIPISKCSQIYKKKVDLTESQLCAGGEHGRDSCGGDSGGPLHVIGINPSGESVYVQLGIVSFGPRRCGTEGVPGVYTNVSYFSDWIIKIVKE